MAVNKRAYIPVEPSIPGVGQPSLQEKMKKRAASKKVERLSEAVPIPGGGTSSLAEEAPESLLQLVQRWLETQGVGNVSDTLHKGDRHTLPPPYLGLVHRIDQPVTGIVLFARDPETLASLNRQFRDRQVYKLYWAITEARPPEDAGTLEHYLVFDPKKNKSRIVDPAPAPSSVYSPSGSPYRKSRAKKALLHYQVVGRTERYFFLEIELVTGRPHQIRVQLAAIGCPVKGDLKYGARRSNPGGGILLHARSIRFIHPGTGRPLTLTSDPPSSTLWDLFPRAY